MKSMLAEECFGCAAVIVAIAILIAMIGWTFQGFPAFWR